MEIVVRGRNVEVPDHFRLHVEECLARMERYDHKLIRVDVELLHERNPRQAEVCQRVELTCKSRGPVIRSEACSNDFYAALDQACNRLESRLRRSADRRRVHHGRHTPTSVARATAELAARETAVLELDRTDETAGESSGSAEDNLPGQVVREKQHPAEPMTVDQALFEMELVGHDFYLFADTESGHPSVVYRRKGYDYGVIRLVG